MAEHFRDIEKIQDILHEAQTGLWAIELEEGREPRMYADKAMLELPASRLRRSVTGDGMTGSM